MHEHAHGYLALGEAADIKRRVVACQVGGETLPGLAVVRGPLRPGGG